MIVGICGPILRGVEPDDPWMLPAKQLFIPKGQIGFRENGDEEDPTHKTNLSMQQGLNPTPANSQPTATADKGAPASPEEPQALKPERIVSNVTDLSGKSLSTVDLDRQNTPLGGFKVMLTTEQDETTKIFSQSIRAGRPLEFLEGLPGAESNSLSGGRSKTSYGSLGGARSRRTLGSLDPTNEEDVLKYTKLSTSGLRKSIIKREIDKDPEEGTGPDVEIGKARRCCKYCLHYFYWPLRMLLKVTCPDCAHETNYACFYPITFLMSLVWIALFGFIMTTVMNHWVVNLGISKAAPIFGAFVFSFMLRIPDVVDSLLVAAKGYGTLAITNAFGSQTLGLCIGIGGVWLVKGLANMHWVVLQEAEDGTDVGYTLSVVAVVQLIALVPLCTIWTWNWCRRRRGEKGTHLQKRHGWILKVIFLLVKIGFFAFCFSVGLVV